MRRGLWLCLLSCVVYVLLAIHTCVVSFHLKMHRFSSRVVCVTPWRRWVVFHPGRGACVRARAERKRPRAAGGCFEFDSNAGFVLLFFVFHTLARRQPRCRAGQALCLLFGVVPLKVTSRTACQHALANLWGHQLHHHCRISAATSDACATVHFLPIHQLFAPYTKRISCTAKFCLLAKSCLTSATVCQLKYWSLEI